MGSFMGRPEESVVTEEWDHARFRVGIAELNGKRRYMEDAHCAVFRPEWGFFGVFDGHGGHECSKWVAEKFTEVLTDRPPADDSSVKDLFLKVDEEFLCQTKSMSGTTGACVFVECPQQPNGKRRVRVANLGDSRVLLGRRDGEIVDRGGSDQAMTTDHKPDRDCELERIKACGSWIENGAVPRLEGDLAVCRGFGDRAYKLREGYRPEAQPVSPEPEQGVYECDDADFLMLVCDGVYEGNFSNANAVQVAAEHLASGKTAAQASTEVIRAALLAGSTDNISCMIVEFCNKDGMDATDIRHSLKHIPGTFAYVNDLHFAKAYNHMAFRGGKSFGEALMERWQFLRDGIESVEAEGEGVADDDDEDSEPQHKTRASHLQGELASLDAPHNLVSMTESERIAWFDLKARRLLGERDPDDPNQQSEFRWEEEEPTSPPQEVMVGEAVSPGASSPSPEPTSEALEVPAAKRLRFAGEASKEDGG
eukprot:Hpha_TRINITY_DN27785_c0_g1::TRINITY_DN27785_c0_g1_i1::g.157086::m.157086